MGAEGKSPNSDGLPPLHTKITSLRNSHSNLLQHRLRKVPWVTLRFLPSNTGVQVFIYMFLATLVNVLWWLVIAIANGTTRIVQQLDSVYVGAVVKLKDTKLTDRVCTPLARWNARTFHPDSRTSKDQNSSRTFIRHYYTTICSKDVFPSTLLTKTILLHIGHVSLPSSGNWKTELVSNSLPSLP